ncbi:N-acetylglucosamine kinase [Monashia sp. NPDC004114]
MDLVLAIDGGNSKTDLLLVDASSGAVLGTERGPGFQPHVVGADGALSSLDPVVRRLLGSTGRDRADLLVAALANADLPSHVAAFTEAIERRGWAGRSVVVNDTLAALHAGSPSGTGVVVICGAGINAAGVAGDGHEVRFPAMGPFTGDWGGGMGLAQEALWYAVRAEDGRGEPTRLAGMIATHFGMLDATSVGIALSENVIREERLHELVPGLLRAATEGDEVALRVVQQQADEICALARVCLERLDPAPDSATTVVLAGGVLAAREPVLLDPVTRGLAALGRPTQPVLLLAPPVLGAAVIGLREHAAGANGGGPANELAEERLRARFAPVASP